MCCKKSGLVALSYETFSRSKESVSLVLASLYLVGGGTGGPIREAGITKPYLDMSSYRPKLEDW